MLCVERALTSTSSPSLRRTIASRTRMRRAEPRIESESQAQAEAVAAEAECKSRSRSARRHLLTCGRRQQRQAAGATHAERGTRQRA